MTRTADALPAEVDVLVAGAGPTGLMTGLVAHRRGLRVLVVDPKPGPTRESRAIVVQARSVEILDQLGLAGPVLESAQLAGRIRIKGGDRPVEADFARAQERDTLFPGARIFEQSRTEALLSEALASEGCPVRYGMELESFTADGPAEEGLEARLASSPTDAAGTATRVHARWLIGADGASSPVRHRMGLSFDGDTDEATFCVADLHDVEGAPDDALAAYVGEQRFAILFPLGPGGHARLIWLHDGTDPDQEEALAGARDDLGIRYGRVDWFSSYRVHHRLASRFRVGPVLLAGDAAHVHSPVGGQGMNTGLQDAHHLAHLLADVSSGLRDPAQLARYEQERRPVALSLITAVDRAFGLIARPGRGPGFLRRRARDVIAVLAPRVLRSAAGPWLGGLLGQYRIHYHPVPRGAVLPQWASDPAVGRRLPVLAVNREALRSGRWQLHTYGGAIAERPAVPEAVDGPFAFPADPRGRLRSYQLYLVRPDGYVAAAWPLHAGAAATSDVTAALTAHGFRG